MESIYNLRYQDFVDIIRACGEPAYRAEQIWNGLYKNLWNCPIEFTPLSKELRQQLEEQFYFSSIKQKFVSQSNDNLTRKSLFELSDGQAIETVLMKNDGYDGKRTRNTLCVSTQAGCSLGCVFCATGQMGFIRNLACSEIIEQILHYIRHLKENQDKLSNIVFMGMGEPLANYSSIDRVINIITDPNGINFGSRRITVSTVGLVSGIRQLAKDHPQVNLAVSLHAADDNLRNTLVPINNKYPLDILLDCCLEYVNTTNRRISFEWALIQGINDAQDQSRLLVKRLQKFSFNGSYLCHVNLIPLNSTALYKFKPSTTYRAKQFKRILNEAGIHCTIRKRRGLDIFAGCGQLSTTAANRK